MTATDKPRLSREHMLDVLRQMIRIRRFEDKCAELYTQEKIRGFLAGGSRHRRCTMPIGCRSAS